MPPNVQPIIAAKSNELKNMEGKIFRSRVSALFVFIFGALLLFALFTYKTYGSFGGIITVGVCIVFCIFAFRSMYYVLTDKEIQIYYMWGMIGKPYGKIFLSEINTVERSYSPAQSPAASAKRLRFSFNKGYKWQRFFNNTSFAITMIPMISPVREQEFLDALKALNPNIDINVNNQKGWWRFWDWDF